MKTTQFYQSILAMLICLFGACLNLHADEPLAITVKIEKLSNEIDFKTVIPEKMQEDYTLPVYYLYSYDFEGKALEMELLQAVHQKKLVLIIFEQMKNIKEIGRLVEHFKKVNEYVHKAYKVHPYRNYFTGVLEGAIVSSAVAKWLDQDVQGLLLFDGFYMIMQNQPNLICPTFAFAKKNSAELRNLKSMQKRLSLKNKNFIVREYDKTSGLPDQDVIQEGLCYLEDLWVRKVDDKNLIYIKNRLTIAEKEMQILSKLISEKNFEGAFEKLELFIQDFSNTSDTKMLNLLEKSKNIHLKLVEEPTIKAMIAYQDIIKEKNNRELNFTNLNETIIKLQSLSLKYPNTNSFTKSEEAIREIKELIFNRKLNIESIPALQIVSEYMKFVQASSLDEHDKEIIQKEYLKNEKNNQISDFILNTLVLFDKNYANGILNFGLNKIKTAEKNFEDIQAEGNPYLKSYQYYFLVRINIIKDNYELAEEILNDMMKDNLKYSTHQADIFFLLGICYYQQFKREKAIELLNEFEKRFPNAPERMLVGAYQLRNKIEAYEEGSLEEIEERMAYSQRKLKLRELGKPIFDNQERIVSVLDKLIKEAEQNEQNNRDKNKSRNKNSKRDSDASNPAEESEAPEGETQIGDLKKYNKGNKEEVWGKDQEKEREKILNNLKDKFPERYRELIEQYYKGLQKTDE